MIFSIQFGDESLIEQPLFIKVRVKGLFSIKSDKDEISEEMVNQLYKKNSLAILFPYLRSLVTDLSSKGSEMPIILPTINIVSLIESENLIKESYNEGNEV